MGICFKCKTNTSRYEVISFKIEINHMENYKRGFHLCNNCLNILRGHNFIGMLKFISNKEVESNANNV